MTIAYDKEADVLYLTFNPQEAPALYALYVETMDESVLRVDRDSKEVLSCTIPHFQTRARQGTITVQEIGQVSMEPAFADLLAKTGA